MKGTAFVLTVVLGVVLPSLGDLIDCNKHRDKAESRSLNGVGTSTGTTTIILGGYGNIFCEKKYSDNELAPWLVRIYDTTSEKSITSGFLVSPRHVVVRGSSENQDHFQPGNLEKLQVRFHGSTVPLRPGVIAVHWYNKAKLEPWVILTITSHANLANFPVPCTRVTFGPYDKVIESVYWTGSNEDGVAKKTMVAHFYNSTMVQFKAEEELTNREQVVAMVSGLYQDSVIGLYSLTMVLDEQYGGHIYYFYINNDVQEWIETTICLDSTGP